MHVETQTHSPDKETIVRCRYPTNWTQDEPKVPKKAKLISPKAYQWPSVSHNSKKQL